MRGVRRHKEIDLHNNQELLHSKPIWMSGLLTRHKFNVAARKTGLRTKKRLRMSKETLTGLSEMPTCVSPDTCFCKQRLQLWCRFQSIHAHLECIHSESIYIGGPSTDPAADTACQCWCHIGTHASPLPLARALLIHTLCSLARLGLSCWYCATSLMRHSGYVNAASTCPSSSAGGAGRTPAPCPPRCTRQRARTAQAGMR